MVKFATITKTGDRLDNEDSVFVYEEGRRGIYALADGLGGHGRGEVASKLVIKRSYEVFREGGSLEDCFWAAQNSLLEEQSRLNASGEMKTTLTLLTIEGDEVRWGHVGDSRIYNFANGKLVGRTIDHSVPQMLAMAGEIREKDIRRHEDRNRLLRVMGTEWDNQAFVTTEKTKVLSGDSYLLCSDGFWEWVVEKQMTRLLGSSETPGQWLELMEAEALKNGAGKNMDNYSAVAVFVR